MSIYIFLCVVCICVYFYICYMHEHMCIIFSFYDFGHNDDLGYDLKKKKKWFLYKTLCITILFFF